MQLKPENKELKNIYNAICHFILFNFKDLDDYVFKKLLDFIDLSNITDREFFNNNRIQKFINYDKLNKKHLIRLATRNPEILNKINLNKFKFKIKELENFLKLYPEFIELFNFNLKNISADELLILLNVDFKYANDVDFKLINFSKYHISEIIKKFYHRQNIINKIIELNNELDNFQKRLLINKTDELYLNKLNLENLNELDWFDILAQKPHLIDYCNLELFEKNDCFLLTKLVRYVPQVDNLIIKNKDKISNLGWENLLRLDFEKYYPYCCFDCLSYSVQKKFLDRLHPR